ncbi:hypothetical protein QTI17_01325 [Variovorax sp. J31P179]|uniref:hypothetical protein n=1 Tax=Variovorax sp. J31P179 TaxID=3053508 RepID=UPI0025755903|nr:hypothetical protein [Variovorax sp. J31P179]MDM0079222.1 hypothetical protein [Variovorax sp. J31P179]
MTENSPSADLLQIGDLVLWPDADGLYCLDELQRSSGVQLTWSPRRFLSSPQGRGLITHLREEGHSATVRIEPGPLGKVYGHRHVAIAYAITLSAEFALSVVRTATAEADAAQGTSGINPETPDDRDRGGGAPHISLYRVGVPTCIDPRGQVLVSAVSVHVAADNSLSLRDSRKALFEAAPGCWTQVERCIDLRAMQWRLEYLALVGLPTLGAFDVAEPSGGN